MAQQSRKCVGFSFFFSFMVSCLLYIHCSWEWYWEECSVSGKKQSLANEKIMMYDLNFVWLIIICKLVPSEWLNFNEETCHWVSTNSFLMYFNVEMKFCNFWKRKHFFPSKWKFQYYNFLVFGILSSQIN